MTTGQTTENGRTYVGNRRISRPCYATWLDLTWRRPALTTCLISVPRSARDGNDPFVSAPRSETCVLKYTSISHCLKRDDDVPVRYAVVKSQPVFLYLGTVPSRWHRRRHCWLCRVDSDRLLRSRGDLHQSHTQTPSRFPSSFLHRNPGHSEAGLSAGQKSPAEAWRRSDQRRRLIMPSSGPPRSGLCRRALCRRGA